MAADGWETHVFIMADFPEPPLVNVHPFPPQPTKLKPGRWQMKKERSLRANGKTLAL
jgi:hypothetical protein